ncbi:hypothetical protein RB597_006790 [Gaeumannomyces tritici]
MAEKLDDEQVANVLALIRKDIAVDSKVQLVASIKSSIKQHNVPDTCVVPLFEALRLATTAQHAILVNAGFTALNHLLTRLSRQEPKHLAKEALRTLPVIVDKLGDPKEKLRAIASQALVTMFKAAPAEVERIVRNVAMVGKNPRAKEAGMHWLLQMHQENGLPFRAYVPVLMDLLEDADGMVRDVAKTTVIELFRNAPNAAKSDLKKQLKNFKVRPAIEQAIVKELVPTGPPSAASDLEPPRPESSWSVRQNLAASVSSLPSERPVTPGLIDGKPEPVDPTYVNTQRELDDIIREMAFHFEGRETEQNWLKREESVNKLRRLMAGNAVSDYHEPFLGHVRAQLDGILKAVTSLRTSLSKEGCSFIQELAIAYGPGMDPMVEILMQTFIKLCAATKKMSSQLANVTVDTIIGKVTYSTRIMQHVWFACQDKNVQPRSYAAGWLKTLFHKEAHHKSHVEHTGGLDLIEKCIKKGLADPNPGVRESMRSTYWVFSTIWPARAETIMGALDATAQKLLQKSAGNSGASPKEAEGRARPGMGLSRSTMTASKSSLREAMLAQKKAMASKTSRPGSAMAHFSPVRPASSASSAATAAAANGASKPPIRQRPEQTAATTGPNSLLGAPVRPRKRPEMAPRPATAGPYSVRTHDGPSAEHTSPSEKSRQNAVTPKSLAGSPRRTVTRTKPGHAATASEPNVPSPSKLGVASKAAAPSPRASLPKPIQTKRTPVKPKASAPAKSQASSSPCMPDEGLGMEFSNPDEIKATTPTPKIVEPVMEPAVEPATEPTVEPGRETIPGPVVVMPEEEPVVRPVTPANNGPKPLEVYEDPFTASQTTPKPVMTHPVLEDRPVNADAGNLSRSLDGSGAGDHANGDMPDKSKQHARLLESGINKVNAQSLDVHGFRKLQAVLRDPKMSLSDDKFEKLLTGLFEYLQSPLSNLAPEKVPDVKAQILATIKLLLKKSSRNFGPHVSRGLESILEARRAYESRTHIVSGMELLADELVMLGHAAEIIVVLTRALHETEMDARGCRSLSMGLHVLKQTVDSRPDFQPSDGELAALGDLAARCLNSHESGVRMDAVQLCVALHARVGDAPFWDALRGVKDDPKSLITYYIVKRQREHGDVAGSTPPAASAASVTAC